MKKKAPNSPIKLNLGCGYDRRPGYINIDVDPATKPDVIHDLYQPLPYKTGTVDQILLQDVLEHFTLQDGLKLLLECQRVLKKNGSLVVRVPNVSAIIQKYANQPDLMYLFLYGDTTANGVWGAHKAGYDPEVLARHLENTKLQLSSWTTDDTNYVFTLVKADFEKIVYTVPGHQPAVMLPATLFELENPRHSGQASYLVCSSWTEYLQTPIWRAQGFKVIWVLPPTIFNLPSTLEKLLIKLLLRPLLPLIDRIFITDPTAKKIVTELLRFSHLRTFQL